MKINKLIMLAAFILAALSAIPNAQAQNGSPSYSPAIISFGSINNANIGQFQSTNAFTGSTNYPAAVAPQIGTIKYQNLALEDDMIVPTNSAGATNTYVFAPSVTGVGTGDLGKEITWVHAMVQTAGTVPTNHVATTNLVMAGYGYLKLISYAVTTGTNQSTLWFGQKISCP